MSQTDDRILVIGTRYQCGFLKGFIHLLTGEENPVVEFCANARDLSRALTGSKDANYISSSDEERRNWVLPRKVFYTGHIRQYDERGQGMTFQGPHENELRGYGIDDVTKVDLSDIVSRDNWKKRS